MREQGVVREVKDGKAYVEIALDKDPACASCSALRGCCRIGPGTTRIELDAPAGLRAGDRVLLEVPTPSPLRSALLLLLAPLLLFVAGMGFGHWLVTRGALGGDEGSAAIGIALMGAWYVGTWLHERRAARSPERCPRIVSAPLSGQDRPV